MANWLETELKFVTWLYKYKKFFGILKTKEFKEFPTKKEAIDQFKKETGVNYNE